MFKFVGFDDWILSTTSLEDVPIVVVAPLNVLFPVQVLLELKRPETFPDTKVSTYAFVVKLVRWSVYNYNLFHRFL